MVHIYLSIRPTSQQGKYQASAVQPVFFCAAAAAVAATARPYALGALRLPYPGTLVPSQYSALCHRHYEKDR